jgi:hypothetical protein
VRRIALTVTRLRAPVSLGVLLAIVSACSGDPGRSESGDPPAAPPAGASKAGAPRAGTAAAQERAGSEAVSGEAHPAGPALASGVPRTVPAEPAESSAPEGGPLHPSELLGTREVRRAQMGSEKRKTVFDGMDLGRNDPELESFYRGRRIVDLLPDDGSMELESSYDTPEELAQAILDQALYGDREGLKALLVTREEFSEIFWGEFPQSRPATNIQWTEAWGFHHAQCNEGLDNVLKEFTGLEVRVRYVEFREGLAQYKNFNLYKGVVIHGTTDRGDAVAFSGAPVFAERNGRWKVYMFHD